MHLNANSESNPLDHGVPFFQEKEPREEGEKRDQDLKRTQHERSYTHVCPNISIPEDLHGEFEQGKSPTGRPQLRYKDVCKRDLKALNIDQNNRETKAVQRPDRLCKKVSSCSRRNSANSTRQRDRREKLLPKQTDQRRTSSAPSAAETVIPASHYTLYPERKLGDTGAQPHNLAKLKRAHHHNYIYHNARHPPTETQNWKTKPTLHGEIINVDRLFS